MKNLKIYSIALLCLSFAISLNLSAQSTTNGSETGNDMHGGAQVGGLPNNTNYSASHGTFYGYQAGSATTSGGQNTYIGSQAGKTNTEGRQCTFVGAQAGEFNTTGKFNTFVGTVSGNQNTTGANNTFIGIFTGRYNLTGLNNTFIGSNAGRNSLVDDNTLIGSNAGYHTTTGSRNVFVGRAAGVYNTTGKDNTYIGLGAGYNNIDGVGNVFIGSLAGYNEVDSNKLHIANDGNISLIYGDFATEQVAIGTQDNYIPTDFTLAVGGKMIAEEVKVRLRTNWPDYVFTSEYKRPSLEELEAIIEEQGHLPNIPSAQEVAEEGYMLGEMDVKLLEKIEELTLYMIEMNEEVKALKAENADLKSAIQNINQ